VTIAGGWVSNRCDRNWWRQQQDERIVDPDLAEVVAGSTATDLIRVALKPLARRKAPLERLRARRTLRTGHLSRELSGDQLWQLGK
jgi:hypothetical protein